MKKTKLLTARMGSPPPDGEFEITSFMPRVQNNLRGFVCVTLPCEMTIVDVTVHTDSGKHWASPPAKPIIDKKGETLRDGAGKVRYVAFLSFRTREARAWFSDRVIAALMRKYPEALS